MADKPSPGVIYHGQLIREFLRGESPYEWDALRDRGIASYTISHWGLGVVRVPLPRHARFQDRISIPYLDALGRERGVRFWRVDGRKPKYDGVGGVNARLFAVRFTAEPIVYITEGEFDCMILHQMGYKAVGVPGAGVFKPEWRWLFRACDEIIAVPDADGETIKLPSGKTMQTKGALFRARISQALKGMNVHFVQLPDDEDVSSLYLKDPKLLKALLEGR